MSTLTPHRQPPDHVGGAFRVRYKGNILKSYSFSCEHVDSVENFSTCTDPHPLLPPRHIHTSHLLHVLSISCVPSRSPCLTILFLSELSSFRSCAPDRDLQENKPTSSEREADSISFASMQHKQREMHGGRKGKRVRLKNIIERRHDVIQRIQVKC